MNKEVFTAADKFAESKKYWLDNLSGQLVELYIPRDFPRIKEYSPVHYPLELGGWLKEKLDTASKHDGLSLFVLLLTAFKILLYKFTGQQDIVILSPTLARSRQQYNKWIILKSRLDSRMTFKELLLAAKETVVQGYKNQHYPFRKLLKDLNIEGGFSLFNVIFLLEDIHRGEYVEEISAKFGNDIIFSLKSIPGEAGKPPVLAGDICYNSRAFKKETIAVMFSGYIRVLEQVMDDPALRLAGIELMTKEEKQRLLKDFNGRGCGYPMDKTIPGLFTGQVARHPHHIAVMDLRDPGAPVCLSYEELDKRAEKAAGFLEGKGLIRGSAVAVWGERSWELLVGMLGILKAGGTYLAVDPQYPPERIKFMLTDSSVRILLTVKNRRHDNEGPAAAYEILDLTDERIYGGNNKRREIKSRAGDLAYIIYTSGSTGRPKGVMVEHGNVVSLVENPGFINLEEGGRLLLTGSPAFDIITFEIWGALLNGLALVLVDQGVVLDPEQLKTVIRDSKISILHLVPQVLSQLMSQAGEIFLGLKYLLVGGDLVNPVHINLLRKIYSDVTILHMYGPTETTTFSTCYKVDRDFETAVPLGKPINNTFIYILDQGNLLQPVGAVGELCIGGAGVARGYLNQPELTFEKFCLRRPGGSFRENRPLDPRKSFLLNHSDSQQSLIGSPRREAKGHFLLRAKFYKTGDLGRWMVDGSRNIEFLGRMDHQVKIRGGRVELGEIESRLMDHQDIKEAAVIVKENPGSENHLCAFIISGRNFAVPELKAYLAEKLPAYMIPAYYKQIEKMPLTTSGKVDKKALMSNVTARDLETHAPYVPPRSDMEKTIAGIWKELLGLKKLGVHDNFFDIGGNSLTIVRLNSRLKKEFKKDIPIATMFTYATISAMAAYLSGSDKDRLFYTDAPESKMGKEAGKKGLDIAVIGMSCRFPGAKNIHEFWDNVKNGIESIAFFAKEELIDLGMEAEVVKDWHYVPAKCILMDKEYFDASFFDYTPAEAEIMDPQMRLFHESCWEGLEDAGYDPETYDGLIGLYAGASSNPLWEILPLNSNSYYPELWGTFLLSDKDFISTRVGYKLGLKGPCITIQTACSTSLAAVDAACQGLLNQSCDMALAGGVSITMHDEWGYHYQEGAIMSQDGHCRAFDSRATGTTGGNGVGVVVLKSLEHAITDRDHIYAIIKSSAVNNDGKNKVGFTAPGVEGQANVIRAALQKAGIEPGSIGYIEAHGTGTVLGDPIEIEGLKQAFMKLQEPSSSRENTCALGSVKANIGHLDAAAGIAGFIKTTLALKHGLIPPSLHFETLNSDIDLKHTPFYINTRLSSWKNDEYPRRAGVSSFGIGGTNVHVVLEQAPIIGHRSLAIGEKRKEREYQLILLTAKTENALEKMTCNLADYFKRTSNINFANAVYTLQVGRKSFKYRKMFVGSGIDEAVDALSSTDQGKARSFISEIDTRPVIFMFPGQGSQYVNMGLELYEKESLFQQELDRCFEILTPIMGYDIKEILYPSSVPSGSSVAKNIDQTEVAQPLLFAFEYALAKLLMDWGINPEAMIGHSIGEYTAACLSGVFSLEDAIKLVALRGQLMQQVPTGAMLSVSRGEEELGQLIRDKEISLAAVNGMSHCVVSGTCEAIHAFKKELESKGCDTKLLHTSHAFHSPMMDPVITEFEKTIRDKQVRLNKPGIPFISNVTGTWITGDQAADPGYWALHLRKTVRFAEGIEELFKKDNAVFLEIGPGQTLSTLVRQYPHKIETASPQPLVINLVRHPQENIADLFYLLEKIGYLWLYGVNIHWAAFYREEERHRIPLPTYPFEGKSFPVHADSLPLPTGRQAPRKSVIASRNTSVSDWFYTPVWEQSLPAAYKQSVSHDQENWLVFIDETGFGEVLIRHWLEMREQEAEVITVRIGSTYAEVGHCEFKINPKCSNDYDHLFNQLKKMQKVPGKIIHLWAIDEENRDNNQEALKNLDRGLDRGFFSLLEVVQAVGRQHITGKIQVEVITCGVHEVTGEEFLQPTAAAITAAIKVIPLEYNNINCRSIDIVKPVRGSVKEAELFHRLLQEFTLPAEYPGNIAAFRGGHRWVQTMRPIRLEKETPIPGRLKPGGVYLVTGGLGGIGLTLAEHLAKSIKPKLILLGRTPFPGKEQWGQWLSTHDKEDDISRKINKLCRMEACGAEIMAAAADITDARDMEPVLARALEKFETIDGILHAAGVADTNGIIQARTREMTESVLAPKVKGTLVLDRLLKLKKIEPDFIVLFSSLANVVPEINVGQVGYYAANEFLDAYACYKTTAEGIFTVSINWPPWEEKDMWAKAAAQGDEKNKNLDDPAYRTILENTLSPLQGIDVFCRILDSPPLPLKRVVVSPVDLAIFVRQCHALRTAAKQEIGNKTPGRRQKHPRPGLTTPYVPPGNNTHQALADLFEEFFGIEKIGTRDNFFELGGDSLKAVNLASRIHKKMHLEIPLAEFFTRPTIESLAQYIIDKAEINPYSSIEAVEKKDYYELSSAQKRLFIIQQMDPGSIAYNGPFIFMLEGNLKKEKLEVIFRSLIHRFESFRTGFMLWDERPIRRIHDEVESVIGHWSLVTGKDDDAVRIDSILKDFVSPFDLSRPPLLRIGLIKIETQKHILMLDMHHTIADGVSMNILARDFMASYNGEKLPELRIQFKDFAQWQISPEVRKSMKQQETYWLKQFESEMPILNLATDFPRPIIQRFEGSLVNFEIDSRNTAKLKEYASKEGITLFMVLLAVYNIFLSKISSQEDIVVGTPIAGRRHSDLDDIVGMFVNTLALRNFPRGEKNFIQFLEEVKTRTLESFSNQDYLFEELVENVPVNRDAGRNPLFDVTLILQNLEVPEINIPGLKLKIYDHDPGISRFDLTLRINHFDETVDCIFEYSTNLFKPVTIQRFISYFKKIISIVIESPQIKISDIEIISEEEKKLLLYDFNDTETEYPQYKTICPLFTGQAAKTPDHIAVYGQNLRHRAGGLSGERPGHHALGNALTYKELDIISGGLAALLREKGIGPGCFTAIMMEPAQEMMVAIIGVLKSGGCYLPIDPQNPPERITYILKDSETRLLLTPAYLAEQVTGDIEILNIESESLYKHKADNALTGSAVEPGDPVYMIYTSGTTGKPKGVVLKHENLVNYVNWFSTETHLSGEDRAVLTSSFAFDLGYTSIYPSLLTGAQLHILSKDFYMIPVNLLNYICWQRISYIKMTPSFFAAVVADPGFSRESCATLRLVVLGGEPINVAVVEKMHRMCQPIKVMNHYGPTEVTIGCIAQFIDFDNLEEYKIRPTIGRPIFNTRVYILDKYFKLLPVGIAGELCLSGAGVAKGYFKQETLTREKFITNICGEGEQPSNPYDRLYRTGDLARWLPAGNIEFLGRIDHQVKIRGFRIELGEIESQLLKIGRIKDSVVLVNEDVDREKYLTVYFVSAEDFDVSEIRELLSKELPTYMIPSHFMRLDKIPLTSNGKVDRKALSVIAEKVKTGVEYVAPQSNQEVLIAGIWKEILKKDGIGVHDNFFDLGGTSLDIIRVSSRIKEAFAADIPIVTMYKYTTIASFSQFLNSGEIEQPFIQTIKTRVETIKKGKTDKKKMREKRIRSRHESGV